MVVPQEGGRVEILKFINLVEGWLRDVSECTYGHHRKNLRQRSEECNINQRARGGRVACTYVRRVEGGQIPGNRSLVSVVPVPGGYSTPNLATDNVSGIPFVLLTFLCQCFGGRVFFSARGCPPVFFHCIDGNIVPILLRVHFSGIFGGRDGDSRGQNNDALDGSTNATVSRRVRVG